MKYLSFFILAVFLMPFNMQAQEDAISQYFEKYMEDDRFTAVFVSPKMFQLLGEIDLEDLDVEEAALISEVIQDVKSIRVLTTETDAMTLYKEATSKINTNDYELLVSVKDKEENVRLWVKNQEAIINELFLLVGSTSEFVMVSLLGNIDLKKISKLAKAIDVDGLEHLEKIDKY